MYLACNVVDHSHEDFWIKENTTILSNRCCTLGIGGNLLHNLANALRKITNHIYLVINWELGQHFFQGGLSFSEELGWFMGHHFGDELSNWSRFDVVEHLIEVIFLQDILHGEDWLFAEEWYQDLGDVPCEGVVDFLIEVTEELIH